MSSTVPFHMWLKAQRDRRPSIVGDFARDVTISKDWPNPVSPVLVDLVAYLDRKNAAPWAYRGLMTAFEEWMSGKGSPTVEQLRASL